MTADEIMLSESQERMLMIIKPNKLNIAKKYLKNGVFHFLLLEKLLKKQILKYTK